MKHLVCFAFCVLITGLTARNVAACSCGGTLPTSEAYQQASAVFIGKVVTISETRSNITVESYPDGSVGLSVSAPAGPATIKFALENSFRGVDTEEVELITDAGSCNYPFVKSESYLVYAFLRDGKLRTGKCTRTRLVAKAGEDIKYINGLASKQSQGILHGDAFRQVVNENGETALQVPFVELQVVAEGEGKRYEVASEASGEYQIVVTPGEYQVWVERKGERISERKRVVIGEGESRREGLAAKFE